jgi:hypothetical protein
MTLGAKSIDQVKARNVRHVVINDQAGEALVALPELSQEVIRG